MGNEGTRNDSQGESQVPGRRGDQTLAPSKPTKEGESGPQRHTLAQRGISEASLQSAEEEMGSSEVVSRWIWMSGCEGTERVSMNLETDIQSKEDSFFLKCCFILFVSL